jgi:hypothetical protein
VLSLILAWLLGPAIGWLFYFANGLFHDPFMAALDA